MMQKRLDSIRNRIANACARAGRDPSSVTLVAVAKTFGPDAVREAYDCGLRVVGESKIQEALQKSSLSPSGIEWHLVGHLQSNKIRHAVRLFRMIHSVDSWKILDGINTACRDAGVEVRVALEVNVSGESSKFGLRPEDVPSVLERCSGLTSVDVAGLMTIPPFTEDPEGSRPFFRRLRELRDVWQKQCGVPLEGLSMGMSHDFEVAIEEGATWIRIGSELFGERPRKIKPEVEDG